MNRLELEVKRDLKEKSKQQNMEQSPSSNWQWLDNYLPEFNSMQNVEVSDLKFRYLLKKSNLLLGCSLFLVNSSPIL